MSPIKVTWKGEFVGVVTPSGTYATSANVKYSDCSGLTGSLALIVTELRVPDSATVQEVYALSLSFDPAWFRAQSEIPRRAIQFMPEPEPAPVIDNCDERLVDMLKMNASKMMTGSAVATEADFWLSEAGLEDEFEFAHVGFPGDAVHVVFVKKDTGHQHIVIVSS